MSTPKFMHTYNKQMWLYLEIGLCGCNQAKMMSYLFMMSPKPIANPFSLKERGGLYLRIQEERTSYKYRRIH